MSNVRTFQVFQDAYEPCTSLLFYEKIVNRMLFLDKLILDVSERHLCLPVGVCLKIGHGQGKAITKVEEEVIGVHIK